MAYIDMTGNAMRGFNINASARLYSYGPYSYGRQSDLRFPYQCIASLWKPAPSCVDVPRRHAHMHAAHACMPRMHASAHWTPATHTQVATAAHELAAMPHRRSPQGGATVGGFFSTAGRATAGASPTTVPGATVVGDNSKGEVDRLTSPSLGQMTDIESAGELSGETSGQSASDQRPWTHGSLVDTDCNICQTPGGTVVSDRHRHTRTAATAGSTAAISAEAQSTGTAHGRRRSSVNDIGHTGFSAGTGGVNEWI